MKCTKHETCANCTGFMFCAFHAVISINAEPEIRERLYLSRNLALQRRNGGRFREQRCAISSSVCPTGVVHGLHEEGTSYFDLVSWFRCGT